MELRMYLCIFLVTALLIPIETFSFLTGKRSPFPPAPVSYSSNYGCNGHEGSQQRTTLKWSRQGQFERERDDGVNCFDCGVVSTGFPRTLDLSIPRNWLESWPDGAYTVVRCDYRGKQGTWKIWGQDYHIARIKESFGVLLKESPQSAHLEGVEMQSQRILHGLLSEAASEASSLSESTFMVTLLCHPCEQHGYRIRGHICSIDLSDGLPDPVTISVTAAATAQQLPDRLPSPRAKLSSWCRDRRALEKCFKLRGISEVILVQRQQSHSDGQGTRLLEGLTSNLFVIRKDKVLQTAKENVLHGYARHLILRQAHRIGLGVLLEPPQLEECDAWEEVFLTSSIKLIVPVGQIVSPHSENNASMRTVWSARSPHRLSGDLFAAIS